MTLMAFLVMLLVGISTLVRVETQAAHTEQLQGLARQYARMGMEIALTELQRTAGPDQRVTATGSLLDADPRSTSFDSDLRHPYWTGVWSVDPDTVRMNPWQPSFDPHPIPGRDASNPKGRPHWLVSGNQLKEPTDSDYLTPLTDLAAGPFESVVLFNHPSNALAANVPAYQRVRAPVQDISLESPSGGSGVRLGGYAYVVLDEGVKIKVNHADPTRQEDYQPTAWEQRFQTTAQRSAPEMILLDAEGNADALDLSQALSFEDMSELEKLVVSEQLPLLAGQSSQLEALNQAVGRLGHDVTTHAYGLLTDTVDGGLKADLSLAFEMDDVDFEEDAFFSPTTQDPGGLYSDGRESSPRQNGFGIWANVKDTHHERTTHQVVYEVPAEDLRPMPGFYRSNLPWPNQAMYRGPTWALLRDFYRLYKPQPNRYNIPGIEGAHTANPSLRARGYWIRSTNKSHRAEASQDFMDSLYRFDRHQYRSNFFWADTKGVNDPPVSKVGWRNIMRPTIAPILPIRLNFSYRISIAREDVSADKSFRPGDPDQQLLLVLEPFVALWNPYNVELEFDAMRLQYYTNSGPEVVVEVPLKAYDPRRRYKLDEEAIYDGEIYRMMHPDENLRRGIVPKRSQTTEGDEVYVHHPAYVPSANEIEALNVANGLESDGSPQSAGPGGPLARAIWVPVNDSLASREHDGRHWTVGMATQMREIFGGQNQHFVLLSQSAVNALDGNRLSGRPSPIVLEPGEIRFFGPANQTPEDIRTITGNNKKEFLLTDAYQPDGGAFFRDLRSALQDQQKNWDMALRVDSGLGQFENNQGQLQHGYPGLKAQSFQTSHDNRLEVFAGDAVRVTAGAWEMGGKPVAVDGRTPLEDFYRDSINWARNWGHAGHHVHLWLGDFNRAGEWTGWGTKNNPTFFSSKLMEGYSLNWKHDQPMAYGGENLPPPSDFFEDVRADIGEIDGAVPPFKTPIVYNSAYLRTHDDPYQTRVFANNNVRYVLDMSSGGNLGTFEHPAAHVASFGEPTGRDTFRSPIPKLGDNAFWGESIGPGGNTHVVLFDLPTAPMTSLADFQHAHLEWTHNAPTYVVGNSEASPWIARHLYGGVALGGGNWSNPRVFDQEDVSYLINRALFDDFFFSTIAPRVDGTFVMDLDEVIDAFTDPVSDYRLPNTRVRLAPSEPLGSLRLRWKTINDGRDEAAPPHYRTVAADLRIDGAFNVNSTSVAAWTALLSSLNGVDVLTRDPVDGSRPYLDVENPVLRLRNPAGGPADHAADADRWRGFRSLSQEQIRQLAEKIVEEVKIRGPFLSLSDFVNRRLVEPDARDGNGTPIGHTGLKGTLQAAIDAELLGRGDESINRAVFDETFDMQAFRGYPGHDSNRVNDIFPYPEHWMGGSSEGVISAGAPGYITQADLLQALAPVLTARSDTFRIRAYGEVVNPLTGDVEAAAWCEAIVQRGSRYVAEVDAQGNYNAPWHDPEDLNATNDQLGRRFEIVGFRWLKPSEV